MPFGSGFLPVLSLLQLQLQLHITYYFMYFKLHRSTYVVLVLVLVTCYLVYMSGAYVLVVSLHVTRCAAPIPAAREYRGCDTVIYFFTLHYLELLGT